MRSAVYLSLGSSISEAPLWEAAERLSALGSSAALSSIYQSRPVGFVAAEATRFWNAAMRLSTERGLDAFWRGVREVEAAMGQDARPKRTGEGAYAGRRIDVDVLLFGELSGRVGELILPHPRMHKRAFVLVPLAEIAPDLSIPFPDGDGHPRARSLTALLEAVSYRLIGRMIEQPADS